MVVSGDGKKLLILRLIESSPGVHTGSVLSIYDTTSWRPVHLRGLPPLTSPALDGSGHFVFALVYNSEHWMPLHTVVCLDAASGRVVRKFVRRGEDLFRVFIGPPRVPSKSRKIPGPKAASSILSVAVSPDGRYAVTGHADWTIKLWDLSRGVRVKTFEGHESWVTDVAFLPDSKRVLSASADNTLRLWDIASGRELRTFRGLTRVISCMALSPDGKYALAGVLDHYPAQWEVETGRLVSLYVGASGRYIDVAFTPDGRAALWASESSRNLILRGVTSSSPPKEYPGADQLINALDVSHDGKYFLTGGSDKDVALWDMETGHQVRLMQGHTRGVTSVIFSPDDKYAASGSTDNSVKLWEVETGREAHTFTGHTKRVNSISFTPDGKYLLSGGADGVLNLWDVNTGKVIPGKFRVGN
jgi:WD40 repeat protein